jgi:hypothetical protein
MQKRTVSMSDLPDNPSLVCPSCGAAWIVAPGNVTNPAGSDGCLRCGGTLQPADDRGADEAEIRS